MIDKIEVIVIVNPFLKFSKLESNCSFFAVYNKAQRNRLNVIEPKDLITRLPEIFEVSQIVRSDKISTLEMSNLIKENLNATYIMAYLDPQCHQSRFSKRTSKMLRIFGANQIFVNSRGRIVDMNLNNRSRILIRQIFGRFLLIEIGFTLLFIFFTPLLFFYDLLKGRR